MTRQHAAAPTCTEHTDESPLLRVLDGRIKDLGGHKFADIKPLQREEAIRLFLQESANVHLERVRQFY